MPNMRPDQAMRTIANRGLGDLPPDHGAHTQSRAEAMLAQATALERNGGLPLVSKPPTRLIETVRQQDAKARIGDLLRLRQLIEATNVVSQDHPVQDIPFGGKNLHFSLRQSCLPGADTVFNVITVQQQHVMFVRTVEVELFDAMAAADMTLTFRINTERIDDLVAIQVSALLNFRRNTYVYAMPNNVFDIVSTNASAVLAHDVRLTVYGWVYTLPDVKENARGVMQQHST